MIFYNSRILISSVMFLKVKGAGGNNLSDSLMTLSKYFNFEISSFTGGLSESPKISCNL